jgi:uncharacterized protein (DUF433 family)
MNLPDFLTEVSPGDVRLTGHRIGLYHVMVYHNAGCTAEQLHEELPTLSLELINKVLGFYAENRAEVDAYVARCQEEIEHQRATTPRAASWDELLRRYEAGKQARKA